MQCPRAALFDLDDTLAPTLQAPEPHVTERLLALAERIPVAILTGRDFPHIQSHFLDLLAGCAHVERLYLLPSGASQGYHCPRGTWERLYTFELTEAEKREVHEAVEASLKETNILDGLPCYGERYVDKGSMISYAMLGVPLPPEVKRDWDPGNAKRSTLWRDLVPRLPNFDVTMGGMTAIDIARRGINKAYGAQWLSEKLDIPPKEMLYVGDAIYEGGNDYIIKEAGVATRSTSGPEETLGIIEELITACSH